MSNVLATDGFLPSTPSPIRSLRMSRVARCAIALRHLRILTISALHPLMPLFYAFAFLRVLVYRFAVVFVLGAANYVEDARESPGLALRGLARLMHHPLHVLHDRSGLERGQHGAERSAGHLSCHFRLLHPADGLLRLKHCNGHFRVGRYRDDHTRHRVGRTEHEGKRQLLDDALPSSRPGRTWLLSKVRVRQRVATSRRASDPVVPRSEGARCRKPLHAD